jgi:ATP-dependent DNA helicase RecG
MKFKETENIELIKSTSELKEAIISISAILNKHGRGTVYLGIEDDGTVVGQQIGKSTVKDISKSISDHIDFANPTVNITKYSPRRPLI